MLGTDVDITKEPIVRPKAKVRTGEPQSQSKKQLKAKKAESIVVEAPWRLTGYGRLLLCKVPASFREKELFMTEGASDGPVRYGMMMFVHYETSNVGPYDELLFLPMKKVHFKRGLLAPELSISRILVSSAASVDSGRYNWGIPKEKADFHITATREGGQEVKVCLPGETQPFCHFRCESFGPKMGFKSRYLPKQWRTLAQALNQKIYRFQPKAEGQLRLARFTGINVDPKVFPDVARMKPLAAFAFDDFVMDFPVPELL